MFILHQNCFKFFREDVLSSFSDNYGLLSSRKIYKSFFIHITKVACVKPTIVQYFICCFLIFIVTQHNRRSLANHLSYSIFIGIDNSNFCFRNRLSHRSCFAVSILVHTHYRSVFRHTVTLNHGESHGLKIFYYLRIYRSSTGNKLLHRTSERLMNSLKHTPANRFIII